MDGSRSFCTHVEKLCCMTTLPVFIGVNQLTERACLRTLGEAGVLCCFSNNSLTCDGKNGTPSLPVCQPGNIDILQVQDHITLVDCLAPSCKKSPHFKATFHQHQHALPGCMELASSLDSYVLNGIWCQRD